MGPKVSERLGADEMTRLEGSLEIEAPLEDVFSYISEGLNTPSWHPSIKKTRRTSEGPLGVGSRLEVEAVLTGRRFIWEQRVVEFAANDYFRDAAVSGPFEKFEDWARFERTSTGTKWTFAVDYRMKGGAVGAILDSLIFRRRAARHHAEAMKRAKQIIEGERAAQHDSTLARDEV